MSLLIFPVWDLLYSASPGLQWWDQTGTVERVIPVERLRWVEQRQNRTREELATNKHSFHKVRSCLKLSENTPLHQGFWKNPKNNNQFKILADLALKYYLKYPCYKIIDGVFINWKCLQVNKIVKSSVTLAS